VSALTKRGHVLLDKISALTDKQRLLGSEAVLELQEIICALRQIFPPPLFRSAEPLIHPAPEVRARTSARRAIWQFSETNEQS